MICTLWQSSCTTTRTEASPAPLCRPPDPYTADGSLVWTYNEETDTVTMPFWYWQKLYNYIVDTQAAQRIRTGTK